MLVHKVLEFIQNLVFRSEQLNDFDLKFLGLLQSQYETRGASQELTQEDLALLKQIFAERWDYISDTNEDYSFRDSAVKEVREEWISFAKGLALEFEMPYITLLMPTMKLNSQANISAITSSFEAGHFFLTYHDKPNSTLELFKLFEKEPSTTAKEKRYLLNLQELYRIRAKSRAEQLLTTLDGSSYSSFWEYLHETRLPFLQHRGGIPLDILVKLKLVCQAYFVARSQTDFFYLQLQKLTKALFSHSANNVGYLYGVTIQVEDRAYYLVEILLDCIALADDLAVKLRALENWQQKLLNRALFSAITKGKLEEIKSIVLHGGRIDILKVRKQVLPPAVVGFIADCEAKELFSAVAKDNFARVRQLIDAGFNLFVTNDEGETLLHIVNHVEIADLLIGCGMRLGQKDSKGNLPLHSAVIRNNPDLVVRFLQQEAQLQVRCINELGNTPLHIAAHQDFEYAAYRDSLSILSAAKKMRFNNLRIMQYLVEAGASPDAVNYFGFTPLHLAVSCCHNCFGDKKNLFIPDYAHVKEKVAFLCRNGANPKLKTGSRTWIPLASKYQNYYFNIYEKYTALGILYLFNAEHPDLNNKIKTEIAEILIGCGADISFTDAQGLSLLHLCAKHGDQQGLAYFIQRGLTVDYQPSSDEMSPLHQVLYWQGSRTKWLTLGKACVDQLLRHGANPEIAMVYTIKINTSSPVSSLSDSELEFLFEKDNTIKRILNLGERQVAPERRRNLLNQKWREKGYRQMVANVLLLPEEYAQMSPFIELCDEAIIYLRDYRAEVVPLDEPRVGYQ